MKRDIIFRGKRIDTAEWVYGNIIGNDTIVGSIVEFNEDYFNTEFWYKVIPESVGQYTGLTTRKGHKIYEGDILFEEVEYDEGDERWYSIVVWIKEWSMFTILNSGEYIDYQDNDIEFLNKSYREEFVISSKEFEKCHYAGNYFDNPELLK